MSYPDPAMSRPAPYITLRPVSVPFTYVIVDPRENDATAHVVCATPTLEAAQRIYALLDDPELIVRGVTARESPAP